MKTGRPVVNRSAKALDRDIATLRRLRRSVLGDSSVDAGRLASLIVLLDNTISELVKLRALKDAPILEKVGKSMVPCPSE